MQSFSPIIAATSLIIPYSVIYALALEGVWAELKSDLNKTCVKVRNYRIAKEVNTTTIVC